MFVKTFTVEVQPDFLEREAEAKPVQAVAELIWNSADADATQIDVRIEQNAIGMTHHPRQMVFLWPIALWQPSSQSPPAAQALWPSPAQRTLFAERLGSRVFAVIRRYLRSLPSRCA
jgi:hypothetical protein